GRVGAKVSLAAAPEGGIVATVSLPAAALADDATAVPPTTPAADHDHTAPRPAPSGVDADLDHPTVKVDGRAPVLAAAPGGRPANGNGNGNDSGANTLAAEVPVAPAAVVADLPVETTDGGLRKRVPG